MFGIDDAIAAVSGLADDIIKRVWPDATEIEKTKLAQAMQEMENQYKVVLGQLEINKVEAASPSLFVSGWRPFIGWGCGFGLVYASTIDPIARFIAMVVFHYIGAFPVVDTTITLQVLLGMLGLGTMRMVEKVKGVNRV